MNRNEQLLRSFCAPKGENREYLQRPFRIGEYVYASDGKIMVRVLAEGVDAEPYEKAHAAPRLFAYHAKPAGAFKPMREFPAPRPCPTCKGKRFFDFGIDGEELCAVCDGTGYEFERWNVCGAWFQVAYLHRIPVGSVIAAQPDNKSPLVFKGDGYEGLLMPLLDKISPEGEQP